MTDTTKTEALRLLDALKDSIVLYKFSISHGSQREEQHAGDCMGLAFKAVDGELRRLSAVEGKVQAMLDASNTVLSAVQAERDRLAAECEALRADAAMLRFLEQKAHWDDERDMAPGGRWWVAVLVRDGRPTFRASITAAMGGKE